MFSLTISRPGEPSRRVALEKALTTIGRSSINDLALPDKSLSRQHVRIAQEGGVFTVEDLGSRNGTFVNGDRLLAPRVLREGDRIALGIYTISFDRDATTHVEIDGGADLDPLDSTVFRADASVLRARSRQSDPSQPAVHLAHLVDSLRVVNEMTIELLHDRPVEEMLDFLMKRVFESLNPDRGAILLKRGDALETAVARVAPGHPPEEIRLSQTLVSAVVEKRQGLLLVDAGEEGMLSTAQSFRAAGIKSVLAAPMENDEEVVGLIYVDSRIGRRAFSEEDLRLLTLLANVAAAKIQTVRLAREAAEKRRMERDLTLAHEIQQKLLPEDPPEVPGVEMFGANLPSRQVSGDYFDFRVRPDGRVYVVIADVCGKGIGPALLMASLQATFAAWADESMPLPEMVSRLSKVLKARTPEGRFVTAVFCLLDGSSGEVEYVNAGHNPPLLLRRDGAIETLPPHGTPLALFPRQYPSSRTVLAAGDLLFLYTDGVTEAGNSAEEEFGMDRLKSFALQNRDRSLEEIDSALIRELEGFVAGIPFADDRTWVLIRKV